MKNFYVGMDIGTNSVGIACTDEHYRLLRAYGKDLWAVRLFDEAVTAKDRRTKRTARRRLQRRKYRIEWLQTLFLPFLDDETFFIRMKSSQFHVEDKLTDGKFSLFFDEGYTDKEYYKQFPTIFHLRKALIEGKQKYDLRLYYLAIHHIIKYRGHFLFDGSMSDVHDISKLFEALNVALDEVFPDDHFSLDLDKSERFKQISFTVKGVNDRKKQLSSLYQINTSRGKELIALLAGGKASPQKLFDDTYAEEKSFSLSDMTDEAFEELRSIYGDDFTLLEAIRAICNYVSFEKILNGNENISDSMVALYEKHKTDLAFLKAFIKENFGQKGYNDFFKGTDKVCNYANYIGYTKKGGEKINVKKCSYDDFLKNLAKFLSAYKNDTSAKPIFDGIEDHTFLPKILNADNGLFPYQINLAELEKIIEHMITDYPETNEMAKKIIPLFLFRIPYYVGPLNAHGEHAWIVKKSGEQITPWNFEEVVDLAASNEAFMRRMTSKCSYLHSKDVLPKCSIYYQKFDTLNQINTMKIDEKPIPIQLKQDIYRDLFLVYPKVSIAKIKDYLIEKGYFPASEKKNISITGADGEFKCSMSSYIRLKAILGDLVDTNPDLCENIILWHTLNTDKKIVEDLIKRNYSSIKEVMDNLPKLKGITYFKDFGKLSKEFLMELCGGVDPVTGELYTILGELYNTNDNLNELLYDKKYNFLEVLKDENSGKTNDIDEMIDELYVSPAVKRGIRQSIKMMEEYVRAVGKVPDKIFIEVTREHEAKPERKESRKNQLLALYKELPQDMEDVKKMTAELNRAEITDAKLRSERLYLYFRQLGRCMYSGKPIALNELFGQTYDVDHIIPQSYTKDDSLTNKVLVLRDYNAKKTDIYPLPVGFSNQQAFWKLLADKKLIPQETYKRLTRTEPLTESDYRSFINRQKVITDQTVKAVAELLAQLYPDSKIVYSKASTVSEYKNRFGLIKCRETNDLHHARDAYMNIVIGNVYDVEVTEKFYLNRKGEQRTRNLKTLFYYSIDGAWDKETSLELVRATYRKTSMAVTRFSYINKGQFYDETIYPKGDDGIAFPKKGTGILSNTTYGGYKSPKTAYFCIVDSFDKKGNKLRTIEAIPVMIHYRSKNDPNAVLSYLSESLKEPKIVVPRIKIKTLFDFSGTKMYIAGITGTRILFHNATEWFTNGASDPFGNTDQYVNALIKLTDWEKNGKLSDDEKKQDSFLMDTNRFKDNKLSIDHESNLRLFDRIIAKLNEKQYQGFPAIASFIKNLVNGRDQFLTLTTLNQATVLLQIIRFMKCNAEKANLSLINGGSNCGTLRISKNVTDVPFNILHRSPCGLTERIEKF